MTLKKRFSHAITFILVVLIMAGCGSPVSDEDSASKQTDDLSDTYGNLPVATDHRETTQLSGNQLNEFLNYQGELFEDGVHTQVDFLGLRLVDLELSESKSVRFYLKAPGLATIPDGIAVRDMIEIESLKVTDEDGVDEPLRVGASGMRKEILSNVNAQVHGFQRRRSGESFTSVFLPLETDAEFQGIRELSGRVTVTIPRRTTSIRVPVDTGPRKISMADTHYVFTYDDQRLDVTPNKLPANLAYVAGMNREGDPISGRIKDRGEAKFKFWTGREESLDAVKFVLVDESSRESRDFKIRFSPKQVTIDKSNVGTVKTLPGLTIELTKLQYDEDKARDLFGWGVTDVTYRLTNHYQWVLNVQFFNEDGERLSGASSKTTTHHAPGTPYREVSREVNGNVSELRFLIAQPSSGREF